MPTLRARAIEIRVFGSLARGDFRDHSDVDFLVSGPIDRAVRVAVEATVARELRETELPYDIIYLDDLTPEQAAAFALGHRQTRARALSSGSWRR